MRIIDILGWLLYIAVVLYAISGVVYIWRAARVGGSVTQMGLFQWALSVTCVVIFGLADIHKLHILWVVPIGYIISFTSIGRSIGAIVGVITAMIFGSRRI